MDKQLDALLHGDGQEATMRLHPDTGMIELLDKKNHDRKQEYTLKPMRDLYGNGTGLPSVELTDGGFLPLLLAIEETFVLAYKHNPSLTDGSVMLAMDKLCMSPEGDTGQDELAAEVQFNLRLALSLNDYSRQDVRHALRKVKQSVNRHNKMGGTRGYLDFITQMLGGR